MKRLMIGAGLIGLLFLAGCWPERLVWAPNGEYAAVIGGDGSIYICDEEGNLTGPAQVDGDVTDEMNAVAWFPDSQACLTTVETELRTWAELEELLPEEQKNEIVSLAEAFRAEIMTSYEGDLGRMKTVSGMENDKILSLKIYLRDHPDEELIKKLGDRWKEFEEASRSGSGIQVFRVENGQFKAGSVIVKSLGAIVALRISPNGKAVACTQLEDDDVPAIYVAPTDGSDGMRLVAPIANMSPDWTPDGQDLIYQSAGIGSESTENVALGSLVRRQLCAPNGTLLPDFPKRQELAGLILNPYSTVRCLADGRILFSSVEIQLPSTDQDMPEGTTLFSTDPARRATVARALPRKTEQLLPGMVGMPDIFDVSPDGSKVAIVDGDNGRVAVAILATGEVIQVQPDEDTELRAVPKWRTADELCFAVPARSPHGSPNRAEIVLWSQKDGYRCISKDWPESVTRGFL